MKAVLWTERHTGGVRPPRWMRSVLRTYPWVWLDWLDDVGRWSLWERDGRELELICSLHADISWAEVMDILDNACTAGRIQTRFDVDRWLAACDDNPVARAAESRARASAREGASRLWDHLVGRRVFALKPA